MSTLSDSAASPNVSSKGAQLAQLDQLYRGAPLGFIATMVNSLILVGVLRGQVDSTPRWLWFLALCLVTLARFVGVRAYRLARAEPGFEAEPWSNVFTLGLGVSGVVWGASAIFLFPSSVAHQSFLAFVLGGMVAGATATFSVRMESFLAFTIPALLPLVLRFSAVGDELHLAMGVMIFLFGALLTATAYRVHTAVLQGLIVQDELDRSRRDLAESVRHAESLSSELLGVKAAVSVSEADTSERMIRYMDGLVDSFDTLQSRLKRRFAAQFRVSAEKRLTASLTTLAHGIVNELRGPLDSISRTLSLAWRDPDRLPPATAITQMFVRTEEATQDISRVVDRLSQYASQERGPMSSVDLAALARVAIGSWREKSGYEGDLWCSVSPVPRIAADAERIALVCEQLLTNASEAAPSGGSVIEVSTDVVAASEVDVGKAYLHETSAERFAVLSVVDNGIGMSRATVDRIFDPFFTTKVGDAGHARGCGLAFVAAVVRQHGGEILVESYPRAGTTISILLPLR